MSTLPRLDYLTIGLPAPEAHRIWRGVIGSLFEPLAAGPDRRIPTGSASGVVVGDLIVARVVFSAQRFRRERALIESTPDHYLFHLYNSGGFNGAINGQRTTIWAGHVAIIDLAHEVDTLATSSDTISLIVPRTLLPGLAGAALPPRLDPARNRLLAAHIFTLRERSAHLDEAETETVVRHTAEVLRTLLAPAGDPTALEAPGRDTSLRSLADQAIRSNLASSELSPEWIAAEIGVSRATLYRLFAPFGGIMRAVQERRLVAARAALSDPLESRRLSQLATQFGFGSKAHFSRSFKARFGTTASEYRAAELQSAQQAIQTSLDELTWWWHRLGARDA